MSRRTHTFNAYESSLSGPLGIGATSVAVDSAAGLEAPGYLVIDPDVPAKREWIRFNTLNGNTLENIVRNQEGSIGDVAHDAGAKIRAVYTAMLQDDLFQDIEDSELDLTQHETDGGDPHAQAGYLTVDETDPLYVSVAGDTLDSTAQIKSDTNPVVDDDLARKGYVDAAVVTDHDDLINVTAAQHHAKYTDTEAVDAVLADDTSKNLVDTDYTTLETDQAITHASNDPHTITLHDASTRPFQGLIIYKSGGTGTLTVVAGGGQDIGYEGPPITSIQLVDAGDSVSLLSQGFDAWFAVSLNGTFVPL